MWFSHKYSKFSHLLKRVDFDAIVDNLTLMHIIKSKVEPATTRIKKAVRIDQLLFLQFTLHEREGYDFECFFFISTEE